VISPGQGELEVEARAEFLSGLEGFGVVLDKERNASAVLSNESQRISRDDSPIQVWIVPTHAARIYAEDTALVCADRCHEPWCQEYRFV